MPWTPRYTITNRLLLIIRQIGEAVGEVRKSGTTPTDLAKLEYQAREFSSYASTSIEGNPLPLTDVKRILKKAPIHVRDTEREVLNYNRARWCTLKSGNSVCIPARCAALPASG